MGSAIVRALAAAGFAEPIVASRAELDLCDQAGVEAFFDDHRPEYVFLAAARVGGIHANEKYPADFIYENLALQTNVIHAAARVGVKKLLFLGSTCVYPRLAPQPLKEEYLLSGPLEPTNEWYAIAKIAGIKLCEAYHRQHGHRFVSVMPTNLYGPGDNFDPETSHVLAALIRKFDEGRAAGTSPVEVWGSGKPRREFLHVDDCASACLFVMEHYEAETPINIGTGKDVTIAELAALIKEVVGYRGEIVFDQSKPDGTPRKLVDVSRLNALGWHATTSLREGIRRTYEWYVSR